MSQIEKLQSKHAEEKEAQLRDWFTAVDADGSGEITVEELRAALLNGDWTPFDIGTVKMLMAIYDTDHSGCIEFNEFSQLWNYVKHWQVIFNHFDKDKSGTIDPKELEAAMPRLGYYVGPKTLSMMQKKYAVAPRKGKTKEESGPVLSFDRFLRCCVAAKRLSQLYDHLDLQHEGTVHLDYDTFMYTLLQVP